MGRFKEFLDIFKNKNKAEGRLFSPYILDKFSALAEMPGVLVDIVTWLYRQEFT